MVVAARIHSSKALARNSLLHTCLKCSFSENIRTSAKESLALHELKQHKPWFDEECIHFLDERKQAKLQWVQDPSQRNVQGAAEITPTF
jgi:hypothetical protein